MSYREIKKAAQQEEHDKQQVKETVRSILEKVRQEGDRAIAYYEKKFDNFEPEAFLVSKGEAMASKTKLPENIVDEIDSSVERAFAFARIQKESLIEFENELSPGQIVGQKLIPLESCGCYVPGGRYPSITSAILTIAPAKVAGVNRVVACSPPGPRKEMDAGVLYSMHKMGVDEIYCLGGAQAIGAFAYGTQTIRPVDFIVGPGNQYVNEAKRQVFGEVGIDLLAGPSECMVIADQSARADYIAADLIAQCEHDPNVRTGLVTTSENLAKKTVDEIERQLQERMTQEVARSSWETFGVIAVVDNLEDAAKYANEYAPEHLELHVVDPRKLMPLLKNYGALFLGENTAEVYSDKVAGLNHPLPTGGNARFSGGLSVGQFLKVVTYQEMDQKASERFARLTEARCLYEGMDAHGYAAKIRLKGSQKA
jgi:sulfopropanediol 3-dehydrogenase